MDKSLKLGPTLKEARLRLGLSQEKLSVMLNTAQKNISRWECEKQIPNKKTL